MQSGCWAAGRALIAACRCARVALWLPSRLPACICLPACTFAHCLPCLPSCLRAALLACRPACLPVSCGCLFGSVAACLSLSLPAGMGPVALGKELNLDPCEAWDKQQSFFREFGGVDKWREVRSVVWGVVWCGVWCVVCSRTQVRTT